MRNFQNTVETPKQSFISAFSICATVSFSEKYGKGRVDIYRDNELAWLENINRPQVEKVREDVITISRQEFKVNLTSKKNFKIVSYLDIALNLRMG